MQKVSLLWGIAAVIALVVSFFPFVGSLDWLVISFSTMGLAFGILAHARQKNGARAGSFFGILGCGIVIWVELIRLFLRWGII